MRMTEPGARVGKRAHWSVSRAIVFLAIAALAAFTVVGSVSLYVAGRIARGEVLDEAGRSARAMGRAVFAPVLPDFMAGDAAAANFLDRAVRIRARDGSLVRVKVWSPDGTVIYSDEHTLVGRSFPLNGEVAEVLGSRRSIVSLSNLDDVENVEETAQFDRLVEAYVPLTLENGTSVVFEMYSSDARLLKAESRLKGQLIPFALGALGVFLLTQLPVSVWLVRRVSWSQQERSRLLTRALSTSDRERRTMARDLHDGVIQDLAGAGYALGALQRQLPPGTPSETLAALDMSSSAVQRAVRDLRTMIVAVHPPDLNWQGLGAALNDLGAQYGSASGIDIEVTGELSRPASLEAVRLVYRCARECLTNVVKHSDARHAWVSLSAGAADLLLEVADDGQGLPEDGFDRRAEGHLGLVLLRDEAADLGGSLTVASEPGNGTRVVLVQPISAE